MRAAAAILVAGFALSTFLWERAGIAFRADTVNFFAQLLDPPLLQHRLLQSVWYLHAQPPLFNVLVGVALKIAPSHPGGPLRLAFLLGGLVTGGALAAALRELSLPPALAVGLALAFVSTPTFAAYEHWCFYPHWELTFLAVAAAAFLRSRGKEARPWPPASGRSARSRF